MDNITPTWMHQIKRVALTFRGRFSAYFSPVWIGSELYVVLNQLRKKMNPCHYSCGCIPHPSSIQVARFHQYPHLEQSD
jgi:hypothetical protein